MTFNFIVKDVMKIVPLTKRELKSTVIHICICSQGYFFVEAASVTFQCPGC